jgi:hypothetical protein
MTEADYESPDEYVRKRRLRELFDIRCEIREIQTRLKSIPRNSSEYQDSCQILRSVVESYVSECEPLLLKTEEGNSLFYSKEYGEIIIKPPIEEKKVGKATTGYEIGGEEISTVAGSGLPEPRHTDLTGLSCLFELPSPVVETWEINQAQSKGPLGTRSMAREREVPPNILQLMVRDLNLYLAHVGIELDLEETSEPVNLNDAEF